MSQTDKSMPLNISSAGVATEHYDESHAARVATDTNGEINTIRAAIHPVACWRVDDIRFEFDRSFVKPDIASEMAYLADLRKLHTDKDNDKSEPPLCIFGHADPVGNDQYNKILSGRRAMAIYGMLVRDTNMWEDLYGKKHGSDDWGLMSVQTILQYLGHDPGAIDGIMGDQTRSALKDFQSRSGLSPTGGNDKSTRQKLFHEYMDRLCRDSDDQPYTLTTRDFLGQGQDPDGRGDCQGCSEFNPVLMFSGDEDKAYQQSNDKTQRNRENAPNRRVVVFLFRPGSKIELKNWPCPSAKAGPADCYKRFWSDAKKRREFQADRRRQEETRDTYACRFYDRIAGRSPCEMREIVWIDLQSVDEFDQCVPNTDLILVLPDGIRRRIKTNEKGYHREGMVPEGQLRILLSDGTRAKYFLQGKETDAVLNTKLSAFSIADVVVSHNVTPEQRNRRKEIRDIYLTRDRHKEEVSSRNSPLDEKTGVHKSEGKPGRIPTRRAAFRAVDNLPLAAGWTKSWDFNLERFFKILDEWFNDYHPAPHGRGYIVHVTEDTRLRTYNSKGQRIGDFTLAMTTDKQGKQVPCFAGAIGAYTMFQKQDGALFTDMATRSSVIGYSGDVQVDEYGAVPLEALVDPSDRQAFIDLNVNHEHKLSIVYLMPTSEQLFRVALCGGTGILEDYGYNQAINQNAHNRNLAVVRNCASLYDVVMERYIQDVKATKDENEIRKLGPPLSPYQFSTPAGANDSQMREIFDAGAKNSIRPWIAITEQLDKFANRHCQGAMFFRVKVQVKQKIAENIEVKYEHNLDLGTDGVLHERAVLVSGNATIPKIPHFRSGQFEVERDLEKDVNTYKLTLGEGRHKIGLEISDDGKRKIVGPYGAVADFNNRTGEFGGGVELDSEYGQVYLGFGFQGLREDTALAYFSSAPGFFERRPLSELLAPSTHWVDLIYDEQTHLEQLGWKRDIWDKKHMLPINKFPIATRTSWFHLDASKRIAAVHLGLPALNDWEKTWTDIAMKTESYA